MARAYGTEPRTMLTSATIANPADLAQRLTGQEHQLVDNDGAPRHDRKIAMWNPPLLDEKLGTRGSALSEAAELLAELVERGARTICFMKSRRGVELVQRFTRLRLEDAGRGDLAERIAPYRAGYTAAQRREIEHRLTEGDLLAVVATNALELGIDIGELDAAICVTFPGTVASLRQMWGRAGRRGTGLALYVAGDDALDQFFCRHPNEFLERPVEAAILDHTSEEIHLAHLAAAAYELPLTGEDADVFGPDWERFAKRLVSLGELREKGGRYVVRGEGYPAGKIAAALGLRRQRGHRRGRGRRGDRDGGGEPLPRRGAPGRGLPAHGQPPTRSRSWTCARGGALVRKFSGDWYTQPKKETDTWIERVLEERMIGDISLSFGEVSVTDQVVAFQKKRVSDHEVLDLVTLDLPEQTFSTQALWYELPEGVLGDFPMDLLLGSLHAAEHSQIAVLPLLAMCDRWDIGGLSTNFHAQTGKPTVFIYDGHPGGIGITRQGYERFEGLVRDAIRLIAECPCEKGCPSCVQSPKCGNLNEPLAKNGARELLTRIDTA